VNHSVAACPTSSAPRPVLAVTAFDFQKTFGLASPGGERDRDRLLDAALDELGA
jgi:hypothetical protein